MQEAEEDDKNDIGNVQPKNVELLTEKQSGDTDIKQSVVVSVPAKKRSRKDSASPPPPKRRKDLGDAYCWICHKEGQVFGCVSCARVYHSKCLGKNSEPEDSWSCAECERIMRAEMVDTQSPAMKAVDVDQLSQLLRLTLGRVKQVAAEPFISPVPVEIFPKYRDYVFNPMDLYTLEENTKKKTYGCTESFVADCKWIVHNCIVFNGAQHKLTSAARWLVKVCKNEMAELEACPSCYRHSFSRQDDWFTEPCDLQHTLLWAKLKGFPFWPGKLIRVVEGSADVRFFGAHDKAWVPVNQCFLLCKEIPTQMKIKNKTSFDSAMGELGTHLDKIKLKFGQFKYAPYRTPLDPDNAYMHGRKSSKNRSSSVSPAESAKSSDMELSPTGEPLPPRLPSNKQGSNPGGSSKNSSYQKQGGVLRSHKLSTKKLDAAIARLRGGPQQQLPSSEENEKLLKTSIISSIVRGETSKLHLSSLGASTSTANAQDDGKAASGSPPGCEVTSTTEIDKNAQKTPATVAPNFATLVSKPIDSDSEDEMDQLIIDCGDEASDVTSTSEQADISPNPKPKKRGRKKKTESIVPYVPPMNSGLSPAELNKQHRTRQASRKTSSSSQDTVRVSNLPALSEMQALKTPPRSVMIPKQLPTLQPKPSFRGGQSVRGANHMTRFEVVPSKGVEGHLKALQLEIEKLKWEHQQEMFENKHNADLVLLEMRASMESEKQRAIAEVKRQCEIDKISAIEDVKKKQWCAQCGKEAFFYCCWNTSYCDYPCQQTHWAHHMPTCVQSNSNSELDPSQLPMMMQSPTDSVTPPRMGAGLSMIGGTMAGGGDSSQFRCSQSNAAGTRKVGAVKEKAAAKKRETKKTKEYKPASSYNAKDASSMRQEEMNTRAAANYDLMAPTDEFREQINKPHQSSSMTNPSVSIVNTSQFSPHVGPLQYFPSNAVQLTPQTSSLANAYIPNLTPISPPSNPQSYLSNQGPGRIHQMQMQQQQQGSNQNYSRGMARMPYGSQFQSQQPGNRDYTRGYNNM